MRFLSFVMLLMVFAVHSNNASAFSNDPKAQVELVNSGIRKAGTHTALLKMNFEPEWHTYWKTPGESGLAPVLDWSLSQNLKDVEIQWPAPVRKDVMDIQTFTLPEKTALPLVLHAKDRTKPIEAILKLQLMVCKDICVPEAHTLKTTFNPTGSAGPNEEYREIEKTTIPAIDKTASMSVDAAVLSKDMLVVTVKSLRDVEPAFDGFIESEEMLFLAKPDVQIAPDMPNQWFLKFVPFKQDKNLTEALAGQTVTVTITHPDGAIERKFEF